MNTFRWSAAAAASILLTVTAHAGTTVRRVELRDGRNAIIGPVATPSTDLTVVTIDTPFGMANLPTHPGGFYQVDAPIFYLQQACAGPAYLGYHGSFNTPPVVSAPPEQKLYLGDPETRSTRNFLSFREGLTRECADVERTNVDSAEMVIAKELSIDHPAPFKVEAIRDNTFFPITPCRLIDTRAIGEQTTGAALTNPGPHLIRVQSECGVPLGATAAAINLTITQPSRAGDLRIYPITAKASGADPSAINFSDGQTIANAQLITLAEPATPLNADIKLLIAMGGPGSVHVIIDVTGYFK